MRRILLGLLIGLFSAAAHAAPANPTQLDTTVQTTFAGSTTTASVSPSANALIVVVSHVRRAGGSTAVSSVTATFGLTESFVIASDGGTNARSQYTSGSQNPAIEVWVGQASGSPGSGTVTVTWDVSNPMRAVNVFEIASGFDTFASAIAQVDIGTATTSTAPSDSFTSTPATDSLLISGLSAYSSTTGTLTPVSGWTEISYDGTATQYKQSQYAAGTHGSTYSWTGLNAAVTEQAYVALEIAASGGGSTTIPITLQNLQRGYGPQRSQQLGGLMQ